MDILAALEASASGNVTGRCKVQKTLDSIPDDTPNKPALQAAVDDKTGEYSRLRLAAAFTNLGLTVSASSIANHRRNVCQCYGIGS
jgi:hypothetical protein